MLLIKIPGTKTPVERSFTIHGELYKFCKMYINLRPTNVAIDRFFLNFQMGKCTRQPIRRHKISMMPTKIADFLHLPNSQSFTGHAFRRTSATLLVNGGGDILDLKRHGGWKSDKVAEGYVAESVRNKRKIAQQITNDLHLGPSTSTGSITIASTTKQSTFDVPPPCKQSKYASVSIMKTAIDEFSTVENERDPSFIDSTNNFAIPNKKEDSIIPEDLIVPDNFFDTDEMDSRTINLISTDKIKNPIFQFSKCNVTINMIQEKKT